MPASLVLFIGGGADVFDLISARICEKVIDRPKSHKPPATMSTAPSKKSTSTKFGDFAVPNQRNTTTVRITIPSANRTDWMSVHICFMSVNDAGVSVILANLFFFRFRSWNNLAWQNLATTVANMFIKIGCQRIYSCYRRRSWAVKIFWKQSIDFKDKNHLNRLNLPRMS